MLIDFVLILAADIRNTYRIKANLIAGLCPLRMENLQVCSIDMISLSLLSTLGYSTTF